VLQRIIDAVGNCDICCESKDFGHERNETRRNFVKTESFVTNLAMSDVAVKYELLFNGGLML
jgi:hypothetical protein